VPVDFKEDYFQCWPVRIIPARSKSRQIRLFRREVKPARIRKKDLKRQIKEAFGRGSSPPEEVG
jgi:hypothetical protein